MPPLHLPSRGHRPGTRVARSSVCSVLKKPRAGPRQARRRWGGATGRPLVNNEEMQLCLSGPLGHLSPPSAACRGPPPPPRPWLLPIGAHPKRSRSRLRAAPRRAQRTPGRSPRMVYPARSHHPLRQRLLLQLLRVGWWSLSRGFPGGGRAEGGAGGQTWTAGTRCPAWGQPLAGSREARKEGRGSSVGNWEARSGLRCLHPGESVCLSVYLPVCLSLPDLPGPPSSLLSHPEVSNLTWEGRCFEDFVP